MGVALQYFEEKLPVFTLVSHEFKLNVCSKLHLFQLAHLHCSECLLEHLIDYQLVLECVYHLTQTLVLLALFKNGLLK